MKFIKTALKIGGAPSRGGGRRRGAKHHWKPQKSLKDILKIRQHRKKVTKKTCDLTAQILAMRVKSFLITLVWSAGPVWGGRANCYTSMRGVEVYSASHDFRWSAFVRRICCVFCHIYAADIDQNVTSSARSRKKKVNGVLGSASYFLHKPIF